MKTSRRSELRAQAHTLSPVVIIGDKNGLTETVLAEIDRALKAHELIKVKAATDDRDARSLWMEKICEQLEANEIQQIGKILVIYRENPEKRAEKKAPPASRPTPHAPKSATRSGHPRSRTPSPRPASEPRRRRPRSSR